MPTIATDHATLNYRDEGEGVAVVMLHATLHDHRDYDPIFDAIAAKHRAIAIDWPGHGKSILNDGTRCDAALFAATLAEFASAARLDRAIYIGNSIGGWAAAHLAIHQPDAVAGLVLVNGGGFTRATPTTRTFCKTLASPAGKVILPRLVPKYMRAKTDNDRNIEVRATASAKTAEGFALASGLWRSFANADYDLRRDARRISVPTLLLWGIDDIIIGKRDARNAARAIPAAELVEMQTGHVAFSSQPDVFLHHLMPFLARVSAQQPA